jgi:hypothetical protein
MTQNLYIKSAYGVIIRNSEHDVLRKLSEKFTYGEEGIDDALPASDILDGEIDFVKLSKKFPGLTADISGEVALGMHRSLVVFLEDTCLHVNLEEGQRDAQKLFAGEVTKKSEKVLEKFCRKYGIEDQPGWITWVTAV